MKGRTGIETKTQGRDLDAATDDQLLAPSEVYHENSKLRLSDISTYLQVTSINNSSDVRRLVSKPFPRYRGYPEVALPREFSRSSVAFEDGLERRRSKRKFSGRTISLASIARILYLGDGIVQRVQNDDGSEWQLRTAPSGGALFPIECFLMPLHVEGLSRGTYFYDVKNHRLVQVQSSDPSPMLKRAMFIDDIESAAACILLTATMPRCKFKYGERAYRFALLETGHIAQNMLLAAEFGGLGSYPIGGFIDDELNKALKFDGCEQIVLYAVLLGCIDGDRSSSVSDSS